VIAGEFMMKPEKKTIHWQIGSEALAESLGQLATAITGGEAQLPEEIEGLPDTVDEIQITARRKEDQWKLKVKVTGTLAGEGGSPVGRKRYKKIKKRMKASFKEIGRFLASHDLPPSDVVRRFATDAEEMMTFPGEAYGEQHYAPFRKACQELAQAVKTNDRKAFNTSITRLAALQKKCHKSLR
jgi:XXXCH domain-containing protein